MASPAPNQDVFDLRKIRRLVELMEQHDLGEIDLRQGETRVKLRRAGFASGSEGRPPAPPVGPPVAAHPTGQSDPAHAPPSAEPEHIVVIKSPMVGTFYAAPDPDSPPFVKVGDHVGPETTVCIVEAMKVFNQIPAEVSGRIVAVAAENGEPVEFGQPLFKVDVRV